MAMKTEISKFLRRVPGGAYECTTLSLVHEDNPDECVTIYDLEDALFLQKVLADFIAEKVKEY